MRKMCILSVGELPQSVNRANKVGQARYATCCMSASLWLELRPGFSVGKRPSSRGAARRLCGSQRTGLKVRLWESRQAYVDPLQLFTGHHPRSALQRLPSVAFAKPMTASVSASDGTKQTRSLDTTMNPAWARRVCTSSNFSFLRRLTADSGGT